MMLRIANLFIALMTAQVGELRTHTRRKVTFGALLGVFGLLALVFGLATLTTALTALFGLLSAFLILTVVALACCAFVAVIMKAADRKHRKAAMERDELRGRLKQLAMTTALGGVTGGKSGMAKTLGLGIVGLATLAAVNRARGKGGKR